MNDQKVAAIAEGFWQEMIKNKKIDIPDQGFEKSKRMFDIDTFKA